ncbi:FAD/FMN-containing dehydrogenase/Fe-S oxidoreductase [Jiangella mangrovi]|uniref:FAD/FMN-containing dehydrogenase/Fe-S oxidoreductase n=2 Tax=Jiangella mangrovi TaxID=1524084 RepID=A0A7W9LKN5_9ACTN|nr:FAD-binding and (Fe-S)-binding domain-containing protein [Jiangella mangrovi]MBB5787257.1 FAD/FMN-containing dehydrogenase/Fe-S oxidoreductase [Jiangella mangrovi]
MEPDDAGDLASALRARGLRQVDASTLRRAEYATDASNYRVVPRVVVFPHDADEVAGVVEVARDLGVPVTARGGGTSVAGNAVGPGIVMDLSAHLNRIERLDPEERVAVVEPGVVLGSLQKLAGPHGLRFGPDPSTWSRCTIGGMIGNNACGHRALAYGRTADNVLGLDVLDGRGHRFTARRDLDAAAGLSDLVTANLDVIRTELGRFGRQISGYSLEHLLPENGHDLAKALVGTEGTCGIVLKATLKLVEVPRQPVLVVLGFPDMPAAADAVLGLLPHRPLAIEGLDRRILETVRVIRGAEAVPALPDGGGWLLVEVSGADPGDARERADRLAADAREAGATGVRVLPDGPEARAIWRIREDGAGLAGRTLEGKQAWPGLEDAAVPTEHLGAYLRDLDVLLERHGLAGSPFGHFGDGCVHVRVDVPLHTGGAALRSLMTDAAQLIGGYGGSMSGEHGDGRARGELLPYLYSERMIGVFERFKALFDPDDLLNPEIVVRPAPLDRDLRRPAAAPMPAVPAAGGFAFAHDGGDVTNAVHRCVGVGKCRADLTSTGGFMCPSFLAVGDETTSTRGRARVLQEMLNGSLVQRDWRAPEVHEALDLCLSCKACSTDCPAGVDMATYKSEVLHRAYQGRRRPLTHYTLGRLPRWARLASRFARPLNALASVRPLERLALRLGGMDPRRSIPRFAPMPFHRWWKRRRLSAPARRVGTLPHGAGSNDQRPRVLLWVDTFTDLMSPSIGVAAVELLESAGYEVLTPPPGVCCGLTWITTGQLDGARSQLTPLVAALAPYAEQGIPIVGLEPSCTAVLRGDLTELLPADPRAAAVAAGTMTLAELLTGTGPEQWERPDLTGIEVVVQPHCHHHSVLGFGPDEALLHSLGATTTVLAGCCGLAGNFGMERGHYEVSVAVAENALLPALREAKPGTLLLADGLSCRTQADQLAGVRGLHLAELLVRGAVTTRPVTSAGRDPSGG